MEDSNTRPLIEDGMDIESADCPDSKRSLCSKRDNLLEKLPGLYVSRYDELDAPRSQRLTRGEEEYYEKQVATLESFEEVDKLCNNEDPLEESLQEQHDQELHDQELQHESAVNIAVNVSNFSNVLLLALKIYATVESGSIAIAASTLDSLLDLMAGGILWFTHLSMKNINIYKYPIGKLRLQPVGIIIFAAIMATLGEFAVYHLI